MDRYGCISIADVSELVLNHNNGADFKIFREKVFNNDSDSLVAFFHCVLTKTTTTYWHHQRVVEIICNQAAALLGDTDPSVLYLKQIVESSTNHGRFGNRTVQPSLQAPVEGGFLVLNYIAPNGNSPDGACKIPANVAMRIIPKLLLSEQLRNQLTSICQLPYTILEALLCSSTPSVRQFILSTLIQPEYAIHTSLQKQLEQGNLVCHYYRDEILRINLQAVIDPQPGAASVAPSINNSNEICEALNTDRLLVTLHDYFTYRTSDLIHATDNVDPPNKLSGVFFGLLLSLLKGVQLHSGTDAHWNQYIDSCSETYQRYVNTYRDLFLRTVQIAREFGRFVIAKKNHITAVSSFIEDNIQAYSPLLQRSASSQSLQDLIIASIHHKTYGLTMPVLEHLYKQSIALGESVNAYEAAYLASIDKRFSLSWTHTALVPVRMLLIELLSHMQFLQAQLIWQYEQHMKVACQDSSLISLKFSNNDCCNLDIAATMRYFSIKYASLVTMAPYEQRNEHAAKSVPPHAIYLIVSTDTDSYVLLTQRLCEQIRNLSLFESLSHVISSDKPVCVTPLLVRLLLTTPVGERLDSHFETYTVVNTLCMWLGAHTRHNKATIDKSQYTLGMSPFVVDVHHPLFGLYRRLPRVVHLLYEIYMQHTTTDSNFTEAFTSVCRSVVDFLSIRKMHFIRYEAFLRLHHWIKNTFTEDDLHANAALENLMLYSMHTLAVHRGICSAKNIDLAGSSVPCHARSNVLRQTLVHLSGEKLFPVAIDDEYDNATLPYVNAMLYAIIMDPILPGDIAAELLSEITTEIPIVVDIKNPSGSEKYAYRWRNAKIAPELSENARLSRVTSNIKRDKKATSLYSRDTQYAVKPRLYTGKTNAFVIADLPYAGIQLGNDDACRHQHPYKPYYYELQQDYKSNELMLQGAETFFKFMLEVEWRTFSGTAKDQKSPWTLTFSKITKEFVRSEQWLNSDFPIAVTELAISGSTHCNGTLALFDTAFFIKRAVLQVPTHIIRLPPPVVVASARKKFAIGDGSPRAKSGGQLCVNTFLPRSEVIEIVFKYRPVAVRVAELSTQYEDVPDGIERVPVQEVLQRIANYMPPRKEHLENEQKVLKRMRTLDTLQTQIRKKPAVEASRAPVSSYVAGWMAFFEKSHGVELNLSPFGTFLKNEDY